MVFETMNDVRFGPINIVYGVNIVIDYYLYDLQT